MAALPFDKYRALLACRRPGQTDFADKSMREAWQRMETDPALKESVMLQEEFDGGMANLIRELPLPETFHAQFGARYEKARLTSSGHLLRQPALWAVLLALAFLVAWGGMALFERMRGFPGDDTVSGMVESVSANASNQRLEPLSIECENLGDTLFLKYGLDGHEAPAVFAGYAAVGVRVFERNSFPVAQVKVREHGLTFLLFRADQQGVDIHPPGKWKYLEGEQWAAAAQVRDNLCFVVACRGDRTLIESYIEEAEAAAAKRPKPDAKDAKDEGPKHEG
jgi:hypothetical protein